MENLIKISKEIERIISRKVEISLGENKIYKEILIDIKNQLNGERDNAKYSMDEFKDEGLNANAIEAEGFLRGIMAAIDIVDLYFSEDL